MKRSQIRNLIALAAISALALGAAGGWFAATLLAVAENPAFFWSGSALIVLFVVGALYAIHRFMRAFLLDVRALAEAGRLLLGPNPERRVVPRGHPDVADLATVFNSLADRYVELQGERASEIRQARADLEEERNQLAALMSELTEGVLVCNLDGQILLYNRGARSMLDGDGTSYVGLGRSVFGVIDRSAIAHALEQVQVRYQRREGEAGARPVMTSFVTASARGRLLRTRLAPFANQAGDLRGYVVTLQDMSEGIERSSRRDALLQTLTERMRAAVGSIRAAIEAVESFPEMATAQRHRFQQVIYEESQSLSAQLDQTMRSYASDLRAQWRLEDIHATDLIWAIEHHLADRLHCEVVLDAIDDRLWVKIDSYTLVQGITYLVMQLQEAFAVVRVKLCLVAVDRHAALDICWPAEQGDADMWGHWKDRLLVTDDSDGVVTLREVADRHGGEVWFQYDGAARHAYFRLLLPRASDQESPRTAASVPAPALESRPEYYDFDLFHQPGQSPALDDRSLRDLTYTVFDTETTGLTPGIDEIVSIGALRMVNGRLLRQEVFEQLVDPQRAIPVTASAIHGITDEMVRGQPPASVVLPHFFEFTAGTVLLGHNLAFDMRMFQEKEDETGVRFDHAVLDTLLLSAVLHPEEESHSLETIADRLGVKALGRHTALGDAIMTGEVFLRMVPMLEERGIRTLRQAREAAQQTFLARLSY